MYYFYTLRHSSSGRAKCFSCLSLWLHISTISTCQSQEIFLDQCISCAQSICFRCIRPQKPTIEFCKYLMASQWTVYSWTWTSWWFFYSSIFSSEDLLLNITSLWINVKHEGSHLSLFFVETCAYYIWFGLNYQFECNII